MADLMVVRWYATVLRQGMFAEKVAEVAPVALHYGATQYRVHVDNDDRYKINQMTWVPDHPSWYAFWEGPEMLEFRARWMGKYQIPIVYAWTTEIVAGEAHILGGNGHGNGNGDPVSPPPGEGDPHSTPVAPA
jgi:hypothetical protein